MFSLAKSCFCLVEILEKYTLFAQLLELCAFHIIEDDGEADILCVTFRKVEILPLFEPNDRGGLYVF
jgi:hypothetical protein